MPIVKEFSAVSGRATNSDSLAAKADSSTQAPGNSKAARVVNDLRRGFKRFIRSKISKKWIREARGSARRDAGFQSAFDPWRGIALRQRRVQSSGAFARWDRALCRSGTFARLGT